MPLGGENRIEVKKNKAKGFLETINTLLNMNAEGSRRYAVLSFCNMILDEVESFQSQTENVDTNALRERIKNLREKAKDSEYDGSDELSAIIEEVKSLVE